MSGPAAVPTERGRSAPSPGRPERLPRRAYKVGPGRLPPNAILVTKP